MPGGGAPSPLASRSQAPPAQQPALQIGQGQAASSPDRRREAPLPAVILLLPPFASPPELLPLLLQSCLAPAAAAFASLLRRLLGFQPDAAGVDDDRIREEDVRGVALQRGEDRALWRRGGRGADLLHLPPAGHQQLLRRGAEQAAPQAGADRQEQVCCH